MSDEDLDPFCPHCGKVVVPRYIRIHHLPMCAELKAEQDRHSFTVSKWHQERKELTDELVKTRDRVRMLENDMLRCSGHPGESGWPDGTSA